MTSQFYHFQFGRFHCTSISDGGHFYQLAHMFANVPLEQVTQAFSQRGLPTDHLFTPYACLYVNTGAHHILVDMGGGDVMPNAGKLREKLIASGVEPSQIDTILITHAHPDHIGGTASSKGELLYPNAHYFIWHKEWDFWQSHLAVEIAPLAPRYTGTRAARLS